MKNKQPLKENNNKRKQYIFQHSPSSWCIDINHAQLAYEMLKTCPC